jgi:tetratricopeptide (TPR) repeat protein
MLFLLLLPTLAYAQKEDDRTKQAMEKFEEGKTLYRLNDFDGAIKVWTEAYKLKNAPNFLYNIAQAYREKKEFEKAIAFYRSYLKDMPDAPNRDVVEKRITEMQVQLDAQKKLAEQPPSGPVGPTEQPPASPPSQQEEQPRSSGKGLKTAGIVTGVAGVALVVTGVIFGVSSQSDKNDVQDAINRGDPWTQALADQESSGKTKAMLANVTLGVGIAAVIGGGVLYYLGVRADRSVEVRPEASAKSVGLTVVWRY